jgi:hypothetical protein
MVSRNHCDPECVLVIFRTCGTAYYSDKFSSCVRNVLGREYSVYSESSNVRVLILVLKAVSDLALRYKRTPLSLPSFLRALS